MSPQVSRCSIYSNADVCYSVPIKRRSSSRQRALNWWSKVKKSVCGSTQKRHKKIHPSPKKNDDESRRLLTGLGKTMVEMIFDSGKPRTTLSRRVLETMVIQDAYDMNMHKFFGKYCDMIAFTPEQAEQDAIRGFENFSSRHCYIFYMWKLRLAKFLLKKITDCGSHKIKKYRDELEFEVDQDAYYMSSLAIYKKYGTAESVALVLSGFEEDTEDEILDKKRRLGRHLIHRLLETDCTREYPELSGDALKYEMENDIEEGATFQDLWIKYKTYLSPYEPEGTYGFCMERLQYDFRSGLI